MVALLLAAAIQAADAGAALRTEAHARTADALERDGPIGEAQVDGTLMGLLLGRELTLTGAYAPRLRADDTGRLVESMHQAIATALWTPAATRSFRLDQRFAYGTTDFTYLTAPAQPPPGGTPEAPDRAPAVSSARTLRTSSLVTWDELVSARLRVNTMAGFDFGGGADTDSRRSIPLQRSVHAVTRATYAASGADVVAGSLSAEWSHFSPDRPTTLVAIAESSWTTQLGAGKAVEVGAGGASATDGNDVSLLPVAALRARLELTPRLIGEASARMAPVIDWLGTGAYERVDLSATVTYNVSPSVTADLRAGGGMAVSGGRGSVAQAQLGATWLFTRHVQLQGGLRNAWLSDASPQLRWLGFVALATTFGEGVR